MTGPEIPQEGWLIHKAGRGWYRPNAQGYTSDPSQAGRFSHKDAMEYSHPNGPNGPRDGITIKHECEVQKYIRRDRDALAALPEVQALIRQAVEAERERIITGLRDEADVIPCREDAMVTEGCADLIEADFSYDEAERIAAIRKRGEG